MSALVLAVFLSQAYFTPEEAKQIFVESNDAYHRGAFPKAIEGYQKLLQHGHGGSDVLYNLGSAHLAAQQLGPAVLYLERARALEPRDDVESNLAAAKAKQLDEVLGAQSQLPFVQRLARATDEKLSAIALIACSWLAVAAFVLAWRLLRFRSLLGLVGTVLLLCAAVAFALEWSHVWVKHELVEGVVQPHTLAVHAAPSPGSPVPFEVHEGLVVRLLESSGDWVRIRLGNGVEGWAAKEGVTPL